MVCGRPVEVRKALTRHQIETATKLRENRARKGAFDREKRHYDFRVGNRPADRPRERGLPEGERREEYAGGYERGAYSERYGDPNELATTGTQGTMDMDQQESITTETAMAHPTAVSHRHHLEITIEATHQEDTLKVSQKEGHLHHQQIEEAYRHGRHILDMICNQHAPTHWNHQHILHHRQQGDFTIDTKKSNELLLLSFFRPGDLTMSRGV